MYTRGRGRARRDLLFLALLASSNLSEIKNLKAFFFFFYFFFFEIFLNFWKLCYQIYPWRSNQVTQVKTHKSKLEKKLLIPTSNFWKCAQGAACARAQICHFWHLKTSPITLKLISHQFAFFNDPKRTTTSRDK